MSWTFSSYLARRFAVTVLTFFIAAGALVYLIDLIELLRRAGDSKTATLGSLAGLAALRTPTVIEKVLPFAVLFGSMIVFVQMSRRLELVVARAVGLSVWQFLAPAVLVAVLIGAAASLGFNPLSTRLKVQADQVEAELLRGRRIESALWLRQKSIDGQAILHAEAASEEGQRLAGVTIFTFTPEGRFEERIEAASAALTDGVWQLEQARVIGIGQEPRFHESYLLATSLTPAQVHEAFTARRAVGFWELPGVIALAERAGLPTERLYLLRQTLLAQPALLACMVLIAASVSLGLARAGSVAPAIVGGAVAGFVLYVVTKLAEDLGAAGLVGPVPAAWLPAVVGSLLSVTVLLHREDG